MTVYVVETTMTEVAFGFKREYLEFFLPKSTGYLAGEFPGGITSVGGAPVAATVRIHYRPTNGATGDGYLVAQTTSAIDGTWRVDGLDTTKKYDVIGRKNGFNDVIMANVSPHA